MGKFSEVLQLFLLILLCFRFIRFCSSFTFFLFVFFQWSDGVEYINDDETTSPNRKSPPVGNSYYLFCISLPYLIEYLSDTEDSKPDDDGNRHKMTIVGTLFYPY